MSLYIGDIEVRLGSSEALDEIVAHNADIHIEQMSDDCWWLRIQKGNKAVRVVFYTKGRRPPVHAVWEED